MTTPVAEIKRWWDRLDDLPTPPKVMSAMDDEIAELRDAFAKSAALPMSDEQVETEFGKSYKRDLELWQLSQENKDFYLGAIAALHRLTAFRAGCKAAEEFHEINGSTQ